MVEHITAADGLEQKGNEIERGQNMQHIRQCMSDEDSSSDEKDEAIDMLENRISRYCVAKFFFLQINCSNNFI